MGWQPHSKACGWQTSVYRNHHASISQIVWHCIVLKAFSSKAHWIPAVSLSVKVVTSLLTVKSHREFWVQIQFVDDREVFPSGAWIWMFISVSARPKLSFNCIVKQLQPSLSLFTVSRTLLSFDTLHNRVQVPRYRSSSLRWAHWFLTKLGLKFKNDDGTPWYHLKLRSILWCQKVRVCSGVLFMFT